MTCTTQKSAHGIQVWYAMTTYRLVQSVLITLTVHVQTILEVYNKILFSACARRGWGWSHESSLWTCNSKPSVLWKFCICFFYEIDLLLFSGGYLHNALFLHHFNCTFHPRSHTGGCCTGNHLLSQTKLGKTCQCSGKFILMSVLPCADDVSVNHMNILERAE